MTQCESLQVKHLSILKSGLGTVRPKAALKDRISDSHEAILSRANHVKQNLIYLLLLLFSSSSMIFPFTLYLLCLSTFTPTGLL